MTIFTKLLEQGRTAVNKPGSMDARDWYRSKAMDVRNANPRTIIGKNTQYQKQSIQPGSLYLYQYDPKTKDDLPYWDMFPLVFPFKKDEDGFLGMNLHYIHPVYRARLMDALYPLVNNMKFDDTTRLRASYSLLNSAAKYKYFEPCIKRYLYDHLKTKFLLIPANEWDIALFLPLERFQKRNKNVVYKDSRAIINGV